jgi:regulation of enolase protein 1 (concanavalin A-like superfamily)
MNCKEKTMVRYFPVLLLILVVSAVMAAPAPAPSPFTRGWDKAIDPDGDCKFRREKDALIIEVPGRVHDLGVERGVMNAPRLLRDVEGDFLAEVRVSGNFRPAEKPAGDYHVSFISAGLLLMTGARTYVRLELASKHENGEIQTFANWELRGRGRWLLMGNPNVKALEAKDTFLRLERQGDQIRGWVSQNGKEWYALTPIEITLPAKLKLGVAAINTSSETFAPRFDRFQLKQKIEKKAAK